MNDLWHVQNKIGYWNLVASDAVIPMGDFLSEQYYNTLPPSVAAVEEALRYNGKIWGIGTME